MQKFIIHISGDSCAGKSTIFRSLETQLPGSYLVSFDKQKWQLSGYHRDNDSQTIRKIVFGLFGVVCDMGLSILLDKGFLKNKEEEYQQYRKIAKEHGYQMVFIYLTAPEDVLLERFRQRIERARQEGTRVSVQDETLFLSNLSKKRWLIPDEALSFDTSITSAEEITAAIIKTLTA